MVVLKLIKVGGDLKKDEIQIKGEFSETKLSMIPSEEPAAGTEGKGLTRIILRKKQSR